MLIYLFEEIVGMKYKYLFWDWNGTLFDDAYSAFKAVNKMLDIRSLPNISFEQYRDYIDVPIINFYEKVMDMSKEDFGTISTEFNDFWASELPEQPLAKGVLETLERLNNQGVEQYIFSSSHNDLIVPYLQKFGIEKYFKAILGASDCYVGSKANRTLEYIQCNNIPINEILFVGDMVHDSQVANLVGADCILISNGHQSKNALKESGHIVLSSVDELWEACFSE